MKRIKLFIKGLFDFDNELFPVAVNLMVNLYYGLPGLLHCRLPQFYGPNIWTVSNKLKEFEHSTINQFVKKSNVVVGALHVTQLTMNLFKLSQDGPMEMLATVQMPLMEHFSVSED